MRRALLVALAALGAVGCEKILGANFDRDLVVCDRAVAPDLPPSSPGGAGASEIVMELGSLEWGEEPVPDGVTPAYTGIGLDLDGRCTGVFDRPACEPPAWAGQTLPADGPGGIDNAVGALLYSQSDFFGAEAFTTKLLNDEAAAGHYAPLAIARIRDFNGFYADDQVTVELVNVMPLGASPKLDGSDAFLADPLVPSFADAHAYVTKTQLVARFPPAAIKLANAVFPLTDATLFAQLTPSADPGGWSLAGLLVGHGESDALLAALPALTHSFPGIVQCSNGGLYPKLKTWICGHADSIVSGAAPYDGACDALSFGVRFTGRAVQVVGTAPLPDGGSLCDPSVDPKLDTCARAP